jgi:hypothetical protein
LIRVKIERAKKHLIDLERELRKWRRLQSKTARAKPNFDLPEKIRPVLYLNLSFEAVAMAGDVLQNLRSALDYLAYHLVLVNGEKPTTSTAFPISKNIAAYEQDKTRKVKGMRPIAIEAIDRLKPYGGGDGFLWKLHELNNIDKHRALFTVGSDVQFHAEWIGDLSNTFLMKARKPDFAGIFDGKVEQEMKFEVSKAFTQSKIPKGNPLVPSLHQLVNVVEKLVLSFRPLLS